MAKQLTKTTKDGTTLYRRPAVDEAIDVALQQPLEKIRERLLIVKASDPEYLESECVVHLLRRAFAEKDKDGEGVLFDALIRRVINTITWHIRDEDRYKAKQLIEDVVSKFCLVLSGGTTDLDYLEVSFNRQLRYVYAPILWPKRTFYSVSLEAHEDRSAPSPSKYEASNHEVDLAKALLSLTPSELRAYSYIEEMGYQASSKFEHITTAATLCGVSGRTIRTWQKQYEAKLAAKLGEKHL